MRSIAVSLLMVVMLAGCSTGSEVVGDNLDSEQEVEVGPMNYENFGIRVADVYENQDGVKSFGPKVDIPNENGEWRKYSLVESTSRSIEDALGQDGISDGYYASISNVDAVVYTKTGSNCDTTIVELIGEGGNVVLDRECTTIEEEDLDFLFTVIEPVI